jgi:AcrR family transcriptional regulator
MTKRPGRPATVNRDDVVAAAVRVATREGLDRFTMNQLAAELGVSPNAAYHHVSSRGEIVQLVVDLLMADIEIPPSDEGPWDVRLKVLEANVRTSLSCMQGIPAELTVSVSPGARRLTDAVFDILHEAGFDEATATVAYGALFTYMVGQLGLDHAAEGARQNAGDPRFSDLVSSTADRPRPSPDEIFDFGFELLLAGLRSMLDAGS